MDFFFQGLLGAIMTVKIFTIKIVFKMKYITRDIYLDKQKEKI